MNVLRLCAVVVVAVAVLQPGAAAGTSAGDPIGRALEHLIEVDGLPGAQAVVTGRGRSRSVTRGVGDLRTGEPFPEHARVRIGSNTKTFTATVALQLVAEGRLDLNASVEHYLPGVVRGNGNDGTRITIRNLMQHTSGLYNYTNDLDLADVRWRQVAPAELVGIALAHEPAFEPGAKWDYSNTNYILVGLVVEAVTGRPVAEEITRRVIRPLGLTATYYPEPAETTVRGPHPRGYHLVDGVLVDYTDENMTYAGAAGAIVSTGEELNRFYTALLGGRLLPPAQLAEMKRTVPADLYPGAGYGLGLFRIPTSCGEDLWGHGGTVPGYRTRGGVTADGRAVTVSVNRIADSPDGAAHIVAAVDAVVCDR